MAIFKPTLLFDNIQSIPIDFIIKNGIKAVCLDVDNTIAHHGTHEIVAECREWIDKVKSAGIKIYVVSNGRGSRIEYVARSLDVGYISMACKPLPFGINKAKKMLDMSSKNILMIGDQVFTDVIAANLANIKVYLVSPIKYESNFSSKIKRSFENKLIKKYKRVKK